MAGSLSTSHAMSPLQVLIFPLLGLVAAFVLGVALYLLWRAARPRTAVVNTVHHDGATEVRTRPATLAAPAGRRHALAVLIPLLLISWVFLGKFLVAPFFGSDAASGASPEGRTRTVQG